MNALKTGLALVGLLVGAGFATGKEVTQYLVSFGMLGIPGVIAAAIITSFAAMVAMTAGSYFLAEEHSSVFDKIAHPIISKIMDYGATITQFSIGFIMIAGAGATMNEQFGIPTWIGAIILAVLVAVAGMLDVNKVSMVIGAATPLIIVVLFALFGWILLNKPDGSFTELANIATQNDSPVRPWWLSSLNYAGMTLATGISMILVIGGDSTNLRNATRGGLIGGIIFSVLVIIETVTLLLAAPLVLGSDVPNLTLAREVGPVFSTVVSIVVLLMVFNTALGMFYALGRRLTAKKPKLYRPVFLGGIGVGFALSFAGFGALTAIIFPILGYIGIVIGVALILWRFKSASRIEREGQTRSRIWKIVMAPAAASSRDSRRIVQLIRGSAPDNTRMVHVLKQDVQHFTDAEPEDDESSGDSADSANGVPKKDGDTPTTELHDVLGQLDELKDDDDESEGDRKDDGDAKDTTSK